MHVMKSAGVAALVALLAALLPATGLAAPAAQGQNLLVNPGFEQPYESGKQANGWGRWFEDTGKPIGGSLDYVIGPEFLPELNSELITGGSASQHIGNQYDPWHAGVKQTVSVPAGTPVRFCAFGRLFANNEDFERAPSVPSKNGRMQVGIYPNGEADWNTGGIVWSGEANPHDVWQLICVDATVGDAGKVTVFTSANYRGSSAYHLDAWWDDASLVAVAPPASPPVSPPITAIAPVAQRATVEPIACETRADGSVIRVVQQDDTLFGIAIACDSTVEEIRRLSGLTSDALSIGQILIVKGATVAPTATSTPTAVASPTPEASPTPADSRVCVEAFNDANVNQTKDSGEQMLGGVGFSLSDASGPKGTYVTSGLEPEPYCFAGLLPGAYTVEARPPVGVASTTNAQWSLGLTGGRQLISYGGSRNAPNVPAEAEPATPATPAGDPSSSAGASDLSRVALGGLGVLILLVAGFMAGLVAMRARR